jgi:hypothetical protein
LDPLLDVFGVQFREIEQMVQLISSEDETRTNDAPNPK